MDDFLERYPFGTFQIIERHPRPKDSIYGYITYEYQEDKDEWVPIIHKEMSANSYIEAVQKELRKYLKGADNK